jgi:hypothetical protein
MKNVIVGVMGIAILMIGCSRNEIVITNSAITTVNFHFRGEQYPIDAGSTQSIVDIPNGTYGYTSTVGVLRDVENTELGNGLSGALSFLQNQTKVSLQYAYTLNLDSAGSTYTVTATYSTSNQVGVTTP